MSTHGEIGNPQVAVSRDYGAFHLDWLLMRLDVDPKEYLDPARFQAFRSSATDLNKKIEFALAQAAFVHEMRHFHDAFGTRAGINLFLARFSVLQDFVRLGPVLFQKRMPWVLPVTKACDNDLPPEASKFLIHALNVNQVCLRFRGQVPSPYTDELPSDPVPHVSRIREEMLGTMIYAFPARVTRLTADNKELSATWHIPLAFDALLEGNAQAIQRSFIERVWGDEVGGQMFAISGVAIGKDEAPAYAPAYNVTDLMVSRYMQNATGNGRFPRDALLGLTDHALTAAIVIKRNADKSRSVALECPGHSFVDLLAEIGPDAIRAGKIPPPLDEGYRQLRDYYTGVPSFETVDDTMNGPIADIEVVFRWVAHKIIVPLLEARLKTQHTLFSDPQLWMSELPNLPHVPFRIRPDGTSVSNAPSRVVEAWLRIRMIERILAQLITGEPAILCPRAHRTAPGIENVNYAHTGACDDYIAADLCGRFYPGMPMTALPDCHFTDHLAFLGFSLPARQAASPEGR